MVGVGRPPIRVSLHWRLLLRLLLLGWVLLGLLWLRLSLLSLLLRLMLRMRVRMRRLAYVRGNVASVSIGANSHFHEIVFVWRPGGSGGPRRLIGRIVTASRDRSTAHGADARASGT